jgi:hypothetical protein
MARRRKKYLAKSNKGKAVSVFINNCIADSQKAAKEREKANKRRDRERKRRERDDAKREKEKERVRKKQIKDEEKHNKYIARATLICQKHGIDEICCEEIVSGAYGADVTVAKIYKVIVEGREVHWKKRSVALLDQRYMSSVRHVCRQRCQNVSRCTEHCSC